MDAESVLELPPHTIFNSGTRIGDRFELRVNPAPAKNSDPVRGPQLVA
jgi:hypothetical protein